MSHDAEPQFDRAPGTAIAAIVTLGFAALSSGILGMIVMQFAVAAGFLLVAAGLLNTLLAFGIGNRMRWAWVTATVWCGVVIIASVIVSSLPSVAASGGGGLSFPLLYVALGLLLTRRRTAAWCNVGIGRPVESAADRFDEDADDMELTYDDAVELTEDLEEYGLRAGAVGTIVDVRDEPVSFEVEFVDARTETTAVVTVPPEQLRRADASRDDAAVD
jgi:hypothetical protein